MKPIHIRKFFILPCGLLILNAIEEVVVYKSEMIKSQKMRVIFLLFIFAFGINVMTYYVTPWLDKGITVLRKRVRSQEGIVGEIFLFLFVMVMLYFLYYSIYVNGVEKMLPGPWQNRFL